MGKIDKSVIFTEEEYVKTNTDYEAMDYCGKPEEKEHYKEVLLKLVNEENVVALEIYAYSRYSGNSVFEQDFYASRDALLKLVDVAAEPAPFWYNTLGFIYYYGRTNNGAAEYDKALQYYTVAACHGVYEAQYKLADMMLTGHGLPKNAVGAARVLDRLYGENRELLEQEKFDCKFADIALRVGSMYGDGIGFEKDPEAAFSLLLQAEYAIKMRRKNFSFYGDESVEKRINGALNTARSNMPADYFKDRLEFDHPALIVALLRNSNGVDICIIKKDDDFYIVAKRVSENEEAPRKYLFCVPEMNSCLLADSVVMKIEGAEQITVNTEDSHCFINHIDYDDRKKVWSFCYLDSPCIVLKCAGFSLEK